MRALILSVALMLAAPASAHMTVECHNAIATHPLIVSQWVVHIAAGAGDASETDDPFFEAMNDSFNRLAEACSLDGD